MAARGRREETEAQRGRNIKTTAPKAFAFVYKHIGLTPPNGRDYLWPPRGPGRGDSEAGKRLKHIEHSWDDLPSFLILVDKIKWLLSRVFR